MLRYLSGSKYALMATWLDPYRFNLRWIYSIKKGAAFSLVYRTDTPSPRTPRAGGGGAGQYVDIRMHANILHHSYAVDLNIPAVSTCCRESNTRNRRGNI